MPPAVLFLKNRLAATDLRHGAGVMLLAAAHLAAFAVLTWTEADLDAQAAFVLTWGLLNFFWVALLGRPLISAALSLTLLVLLIVLSRFKYDVQMMTVTFVDVMLIDDATVSFLMSAVPGLSWQLAMAAPSAGALLVLAWWIDPLRIGRGVALAGCILCSAALATLSFAVPTEREDEFLPHQYFSKFARSGAVAAVELLTRGVLEADVTSSDHLKPDTTVACAADRKPPHIVMVFDESSFDATLLPNVKVPANYREHFRSADGKLRSLMVEGAGGPSWYTEYNVLTGLSVRSFGRFAESVTRLAAGRVKRGLPRALRRCQYRTYSLYSWFGAFAGARSFQTTTGIQHFLDAEELRTGPADTDIFFYDHARRVIAEERDRGPVFILVYLAVNHFPWNYRYRPDLLPSWVNPGNPYEIDEYLRRQEMSTHDYAQFKQRLRNDHPDDQFLIIRFGDHQPLFARRFLEPGLAQADVAQRILNRDAHYFTTYYAIEGVNFRPVDVSSALDTLDAPYLPLVVQEAAGLRLGPSFTEQKRILERCGGMFYRCADGAEARRFNRLLIDAGLIQGF
jgi:hypothetical protein